MSLVNFMMLALAGALGTVSRHALGVLGQRYLAVGFPAGTFLVNALGCFGIGFLGTLADERAILPPEWRIFVLFGFLGAFTTCSSFTYETWLLLKDGEYFFVTVQIFGNLVAWFASLLLGVWLGRVV